ncbi:MAG: hypothetical protein ACOCXM_00040 [Myxococcota bacterium]
MRSLSLFSFVITAAFAVGACSDDEGGSPFRDAGGDAAPADAGVAVCPPGECDLAEQDCEGADEGCYFAEPADGGAAAPMCAVEGPGGDGDECMDANDCGVGLMCVGPTGMMGTCRPVCCLGSDDPCPVEDGGTALECLIPVAGAGENDTGVGACAVPNECDLLDQAACGMGEACYPSVKPGVTVCIGAGQLTEGQACDFANDCVAGLACTDGECTKLCDRTETGEGTGCTASQACVELVGFDASVGVCDPPL